MAQEIYNMFLSTIAYFENEMKEFKAQQCVDPSGLNENDLKKFALSMMKDKAPGYKRVSTKFAEFCRCGELLNSTVDQDDDHDDEEKAFVLLDRDIGDSEMVHNGSGGHIVADSEYKYNTTNFGDIYCDSYSDDSDISAITDETCDDGCSESEDEVEPVPVDVGSEDISVSMNGRQGGHDVVIPVDDTAERCEDCNHEHFKMFDKLLAHFQKSRKPTKVFMIKLLAILESQVKKPNTFYSTLQKNRNTKNATAKPQKPQ